MKILIIACFLAAAAAKDLKVTEAEEKTCAGEYLHGGNLTSRCDDVIKYMEKEMTEFIVGDTTFDFSLNCIKENMRRYNFLDFFLHLEFEMKPEDSVAIRLQEIRIRDAVQSLCRRSNGFDGLFNQLLEEMKSYQEKEKYQCLYKYSIEKKWIEKSDFDFDTRKLDCSSFYPDFDGRFNETIQSNTESPSKLEKCRYERMIGYHFLRDMEVYAAVATFELSVGEKARLKALYWDWFTGGDRIILECVRDTYKTV